MRSTPTAVGAARRILDADRAIGVAQNIARQRPDLLTQARRRRALEVRAALEIARSLASNDPLRLAIERVAAAHDGWQEAAPESDDEARLADEYTIALFALTRALRGPSRRGTLKARGS